MKEEKFETEGWKEIGNPDSMFRRGCLLDPIDLSLVARQNLETGEIRLEVQIHNAERISIAVNFAMLLSSLGWGAASLAVDVGLLTYSEYMDCRAVLKKVSSCLYYE